MKGIKEVYCFFTTYIKFNDWPHTRVNDIKTSVGYFREIVFTSTKARKKQLKSELNNLRKSPSITINDYILWVKELADALGSIGSILDDDDLITYVLWMV